MESEADGAKGVNPYPVTERAAGQGIAACRRTEGMHSLLLGLFGLMMVGVTPVQASSGVAAHDSTALPSINAQFLTLDADQKTVLDRVRVQLAPQGLRTTETWRDLRRVTVQNFMTDQAWIIDPARQVAYELVLVETPADADEVHTLPSGVMMIEPCAGTEGVRTGTVSWRGQTLQHWRCLLPNGQLWSVQYFSEYWGLVVREVGPDQLVRELRSIQSVNWPASVFMPGSATRPVDIVELVSGAPALQRFEP